MYDCVSIHRRLGKGPTVEYILKTSDGYMGIIFPSHMRETEQDDLVSVIIDALNSRGTTASVSVLGEQR